MSDTARLKLGKLRLNKETVRELSDREAMAVKGGCGGHTPPEDDGGTGSFVVTNCLQSCSGYREN